MTVTIEFGEGWTERDAAEAEARGYLAHAVAVFLDGRRFAIVFYDPVRLQQDLEAESRSGRHCIAEPGMIVIETVTTDKMLAAVNELQGDGFFEYLRPLPHDALKGS